MITTIITTVIIGAIIGALARLALPGAQDISTVVTIILGALGALVGSYVWTGLLNKADTKGIDWIALFIGVVAAAALITIYGMVMGKKQS